MPAMRRLAGLIAGALAAAPLAVAPALVHAEVPAEMRTGEAAQAPPAAVPIHWGQSPYYPNCLEGPCRVVLIADKTGHPAVEAQVHRWVRWMNHVRVHHDLRLPAFAHIGSDDGMRPDPSCAVAPGFISICRNDAIVNGDCGTDPAVIRCSAFNYSVGDNHLIWNRSSIRTAPLDAADTWTVVCGALGRAIGLPQSGDAGSCLSGDLTLGSGRERYYVTADWVALLSAYGHPAGS